MNDGDITAGDSFADYDISDDASEFDSSELESQISDLKDRINALEALVAVAIDRLSEKEDVVDNSLDTIGKDIPDLDNEDDKDWTFPDSQYAAPTTKSVERGYSATGNESDKLRLYQFDASTFSPIACADLVGAPDGSPSSTNDYVLVRKVVAGVPTLVYSPVVEMTVMTVAYTNPTNSKTWTITPRKVKILCNESDSTSVEPLTFTRQTLVEDVNVHSSGTPLQQRKVEAYVLSPTSATVVANDTSIGNSRSIIAIEGCT